MKKERTNHERGHIFSKWHVGCCGLMLAGGMLCSCPPAMAQEPHRDNVTISVKEVSLLQALQELNRRYDNRVMFKKEEVEKAKATVTVDLNGTSLYEAVQACIKGTHLQAVRRGNVIVVGPKSEQPSAPQQKKTVRGQVVDAAGHPLPGVSVMVKGTTTGTATDLDGNYSLSVMGEDPTLLFTMVGMKSVEERVGKRADIRVTMQENAELMDEVVVTGYQTISKERATGAFAKVTSEDLQTQRLSSVSSMLEGHVAGFSDGRIRGVSTMNGVATPLYVIDGFPVEKTTNDGYGNWVDAVPDINVEDIESITVLKDAAAASIYGARAANGVVVITTKRAKKDQLNVSFSATMSVQPYDYYTGHLADAATMVGLEREWVLQNPNLHVGNIVDGKETTAETIRLYAQDALNNMTYPTQGIRNILNFYAGNMSCLELNAVLDRLASQGYRYYKDMEKYGKCNPFTQQYTLNIGKGSERNTFNASFAYTSNQLEDKYSDNRTIGINLQNSTKLTSWLTFDVGTYINYGLGNTQTFDLLSPGYTYMPYDALMDEGGVRHTNTEEDRYSQANLNTLHSNGLYNLDITPLDEIGMNLRRNRDFSNRTYARLTFQFTDWLKYTASFQYEYAEYKNKLLRSQDSYYVRNRVNTFATAGTDGTVFNLPYGDIYYTESNTTHAYNFRQQLDFHKTFAGVHDVTALFGTETRENKMDYANQTLYNYDSDLLTYTMIDANMLSTLTSLWGYASFGQNDNAYIRQLVNRYVSFYGNAAYTFDSRYMLTGSIRWDKTNLFATGSRFQKKPIWSVGAGWNIDREKFFDVEWVNMLKLRLSYGIGGNIAKDSAPYMTASYSNNNHVGGIQGTIQSRPNPDLRWEKTTTFNIGVDFALLDNRLNGSIEYYNKKGSDLLANTMGVPTEGWGYSTYTINNGKMTNQGFELTLSADVIRRNDWTWNISGVLGYNKNKVTYVNVEAPGAVLVIDYPTAYPRIGLPYNAIYAYEWAGLSENGTPQLYDLEGNLYTTMTPTEVEDLVYQGTTVPVYSGSVNTNLSWRNWELAAQFAFEGGHKMRNTNVAYADWSSPYGNLGPISASISDRWQQPGDEAYTDVPRFLSAENPLYNSAYYNMYARSSVNVISATNWRLKNLSLTYRIPTDFCRKLSLQNARIMLGMEDVFMVAKSRDAKYLLGGFVKPTYICGIYLNF